MIEFAEKIKIAIVDDEELIARLIKDFLVKTGHIEVILTAGDGEEFIDKLRLSEVHPELVLLDLKMKKMDGIETTTILKNEFPQISIIVISSYYKKSFLGYMIKTGVNAFLPKGVSPDELHEAILSVYKKGHYFMQDQVEAMREQISAKAPRPVFSSESALTERETDVLKLLCQQKTAQEIADLLFISKKTVEGHKSNLLLKTGAKNTAGLVIYSVKHNLIDLNEYATLFE
jgi:DNA-binding NarL/FixJ family response regulator